MSISPYFRHVTAPNEQSLINDLTEETIFQRGLDLYYIVREESNHNFDYLFGEDPENSFGGAIQLEMMLSQISTGFDGEMSTGRFLLEMGDIATFTCSVTRFQEEVTSIHPEIVRPREGDLIMFMTDPSEKRSVFEITYTEKEMPFYQIGKSNVFRMETERFSYNHEDMNTGLPEIDTTPLDMDKELSDSTPIQTESDTFVDFSEDDPFSNGDY
jgi:hypothetical protein